MCRLGQLARQRGDNHGAALAFREALDLWSAQDDHYYIMLALAGLAEIASSRGQAHAAATLVGAIDTLVYKAGAALFASARANRDRAASMARAALGGERCDELYTAGQRMQLVEVVALAAAIPVPDTAAESPLTARQTEIVRHIASGRTDQEIAAMLFISHRTVNAHVAHILSRLQVRTRHEATRRARDLGLLPRDEGARYT